MPGFDCKRFVAIRESERDDFMCGICLGILNNPFAANCCKKLYCFDCITEWLTCSTTCPYDRSHLQHTDLKKSNKVWQQMKDLEIHCEYEPYGCEHTIQLSGLSTHMKSCQYDPDRKCETCGLIMGDINKHNCIELLIAAKDKFREENIELKLKLNSFKERIFEDERHCWDDPIYNC